MSSADEGEQVQYRCIHEMEWTDAWLVSLYWAVTTMTTTGYGDVTPANTWETMLTLVCLLEAGCAFSYMVGNMATLLSRQNLRRKRYQEQMEAWEFFFHESGMQPALVRQIRDYMSYRYQYPVARLPEFARDQLCKPLLQNITGHLYADVLHQLPMFKGLDATVMTEIGLILEPIQAAPKAIIYREGTEGDCMYFLSSGQVHTHTHTHTHGQVHTHTHTDRWSSQWKSCPRSNSTGVCMQPHTHTHTHTHTHGRWSSQWWSCQRSNSSRWACRSSWTPVLVRRATTTVRY